MGEFDLIKRYFVRQAPRGSGVDLGVGDDCALLRPQPGMQLAVSTDMLVEGRHFFPTVDPLRLGHKALAVNLSDLAAMGAQPLAFTLSLALPNVDEPWLAAFAQGLWALSDHTACPLVGGDTTRGPLNISITVMGQLPPGQALLRSAAQVGDDIYVSGQLGDARLGLEALQGHIELDQQVLQRCRDRLERPDPRLALGQNLRGVAHAAADTSDGLVSDLGHVLVASEVAAELWWPSLWGGGAVSMDVRAQGLDRARTCVLAGGDDYELVFTAPTAHRERVAQAAAAADLRVTRVGRVVARTPGKPLVRVLDEQGLEAVGEWGGYDHFG
ncbi:MAG: hypothetical protein RJA09_179 [Pseudomonadota bacterium]|jgi:thiamine-monophosphate kinase